MIKKHRTFNAGLVCGVLLCLASIIGHKVNTAEAQDCPPKNPLQQPEAVPGGRRLKVSYLGEFTQGQNIELLMMSGQRVRGALLNVKTEHDVIIIDHGGGRLGWYKAVAVAGVSAVRK